MPSEAEFQNTLNLLAEYVEDIGDTVDEKFIEDIVTAEKADQDISLTGHRCKDDDSIYVVAGHPDERSVNIAYFYSIQMTVESLLDEDTAEAIVSELDTDSEEISDQPAGVHTIAAEHLISGISDGQQGAFENYLYMMISGGDHHTRMFNDELDGIRGLSVSSIIFPYERDFGISDFYDAVTSVLEAGKRIEKLIGRTIYIDVDEENPADSELKLNFNW